MVIDIQFYSDTDIGRCSIDHENKLPHNLVGYGATKLWSKYAGRKDAYFTRKS